MSSVEDLHIDSSEHPKPKPAPRKRIRNNRISSPEHAAESATSEKSFDVDVNVFVTRKTNKFADFTSDDISEITNTDQHEESKGTASASDMRSYRDKLKERFLAVKKKSSQNLLKRNKFKSHADNILSLNKSLEALKLENTKVDEQFGNKRTVQYVAHNANDISNAEKYQFFVESIPDNSTEYETHDNDEKDEMIVPFVEKQLPENKSKEFKEFESEFLWTAEKFSIENKPRGRNVNTYLENEGLLVPNPPNFPKRHLDILRKRLEISGQDFWFDGSGNVNYDETIVLKKSYRPQDYSKAPSAHLPWRKPALNPDETLESVLVESESTEYLEVNIGSLRFTKHYLFSEEHIHQEILIDLFDKYVDFKRLDRQEKLKSKWLALRDQKAKIWDEMNSSGDQNHTSAKKKIENLTWEIRKARNEYFAEAEVVRNTVKNLLRAWKALKKCRENNGFSSTDVKLIIRKTGSENQEVDFKDVLEEVLQEKEAEYKKALKSYKVQMLKWKNDKKNAYDENEEPEKPLRNINPTKVEEELKKNWERSLGDKTEPKLYFSINYDNLISNNPEENDEKQRRKNVQNRKIFLRFYCDELEICKSKIVPLKDSFKCTFDESFCLKLVDSDSKEIRIDLYEQIHLKKTKISEITVKIPKKKRAVSGKKYQEIEFNNTDKEENKFCTGFLNIFIAWTTQVMKNKENVSVLAENNIENADGSINLEKLKTWIETNNPDPFDPKNAPIFEYLKGNESSKQENTSKKVFRCDPYLESFKIGRPEDLDDNIRFQLLQLRNQNEPEFAGMMIPNRIKEIPTNIFTSYKRRLAEENYEEYLQEDVVIRRDDIITQRSLGRKYLRQMHIKVFQLCRNSEDNLTVDDVVNEKMLNFVQNYLKVSLFNFLNWFKFQPKLSRQLPVMQSENSEDQINENVTVKSQHKILIHLREAKNLLGAKTNQKKSSAKSSSSRTESQSLNNGFYVEISYENISIQSNLSANDVNNPIWNEILHIPLEYSSIDYLNPNAFNGNVSIKIYQQVEEDKKTINYWMGSLEVPISAACEAKLDGHFIINMPQFNFNYKNFSEEEVQKPSTPRNHKNLAVLLMSLWVEPKTPKLSIDLYSLPCNEPPYLRDHIFEWNKSFNNEHPSKKFSALVIDSSLKTVCITRCIRALETPQLIPDGFDVNAEQCIRYVSLIPETSTNKFYQNLHLSAEKIIKLGMGSRMDRTIMLTCYLLSLKLNVWLLVGMSKTHGSTYFVLLREENPGKLSEPNFYVFDVSCGLKFHIADRFSPLKKVYCVVNDKNVWANLQHTISVENIRFDFGKRFDWLPLFDKHISGPSNSLQGKIDYLGGGINDQLKFTLEKKIHKKFAKIRTHHVTIWNHYVSELLKTTVCKLEQNFMNGKTNISLSGDLQEILNGYKISGSIFCIPFSSSKEVLERVLQMKIHENSDEGVEFSLAIETVTYSNQVVAVWVASLSLVKKH